MWPICPTRRRAASGRLQAFASRKAVLNTPVTDGRRRSGLSTHIKAALVPSAQPKMLWRAGPSIRRLFLCWSIVRRWWARGAASAANLHRPLSRRKSRIEAFLITQAVLNRDDAPSSSGTSVRVSRSGFESPGRDSIWVNDVSEPKHAKSCARRTAAALESGQFRKRQINKDLCSKRGSRLRVLCATPVQKRAAVNRSRRFLYCLSKALR
jgi:hypothetical protein